MTGLSPKISTLDEAQLKVSIVKSSWHPYICDALVSGAKKALDGARCKNVSVHKVAGSFEIPLAAQKLLDAGSDLVIAIGLILKGDTPHFDYVCQGVANGIMQVSLTRNKPIGFGILMCDSLEQAHQRAGLSEGQENRGFDAAIAALSLALEYEGI
ncbi:MAG: 6,7-dimethyl-8-ribityllumazine synthase [Actinobacteria bacterium]|nr:6,7-dimethyl-8-ribityllumazine synthase [Actinomycetota bacterium]